VQRKDIIFITVKTGKVNNIMQALEFQLLYFLQSLHTPWLDRIMTSITLLGEVGMIWIIIGVLLLCFKKTRRIGICVLSSLVFGTLIGNGILKNLIARDRPCWIDPSVKLLIGNQTDYSFPSGHTLASVESAVSIWLYNRRWGTAALILAFLIGFSRLYLFVHFPSDVVAAAILGVMVAWAVHKAVGAKLEKKGI
jgi:undecaprenyl-diphosphatase